MSVKFILQLCVTYIISLYYGIIITFRLAKLVFTLGPSAVFGMKSYSRPEAFSDPDLGEHGFLHLEEVRLHHVASGPEDKPLMLFLHGFPEFWYSWRYQIREFQKDYRVVAIDLRGFGESDKPAGKDNYVMWRLMKDVKQAILALGYKRCVLVAHDNGTLAWNVGREFPECVDKLIIMNAPSGPVIKRVFNDKTISKEQQKMSWYAFFFQLPVLPEIFFRHCNFQFIDHLFGIPSPGASKMMSKSFENKILQSDIDAYKYIFSQPNSITPPINWYRSMFGQKRLEYDMDYSMPVLLIWGMQDVALNKCMPDMVEEMNQNITVRRISKAGHFVQMDTPDLVNTAMREWLSQHSS